MVIPKELVRVHNEWSVTLLKELDFSKVVNLKVFFIKTQLWLFPKNLSECIMNGL